MSRLYPVLNTGRDAHAMIRCSCQDEAGPARQSRFDFSHPRLMSCLVLRKRAFPARNQPLLRALAYAQCTCKLTMQVIDQ